MHTARGSMQPPNDAGVVAVLDGRIVKLTPLKTANIPPPMALHDIEVASNAIDVALNHDASSIAVLHNDGISIFGWSGPSAASTEPELIGKVSLGKSLGEFTDCQQVVFGQNNQILALQRTAEADRIRSFGFNDATGRVDELETLSSNFAQIAAIFQQPAHNTHGALCQGRGGELQSLDRDAHVPLDLGRGRAYLPWVEMASYEGQNIAFGMTAHGHLYANSRQLVKNCTSFVVTPAHLIFTTTTHLLKFVHIEAVESK